MPRGRVAFLTVLAVLAGAGTGCGSGSNSDSGESSESADLAASLPGDPELVAYLDLDAAREEIGVAAETDPVSDEAIRGDAEDEEAAELYLTAIPVLPHVSDSYSQRFELDATAEAIDHSQVTAAASGQGGEDGAAVALATGQPFSEIAENLEAAGFQLEGDVLDGDGVDPEPAYPYVAEADDGTIVVATELAAAQEAAAGEFEAGAAAALVGELDQPQRQAIISEAGCVTASAIGGDVGGSELEFVIQLDGEAEADRVASEATLVSGEAVELGEPAVDGDLARVAGTASAEEGDSTGQFAGGGIFPDQLYDCG